MGEDLAQAKAMGVLERQPGNWTTSCSFIINASIGSIPKIFEVKTWISR